jgi:hypothetical protein
MQRYDPLEAPDAREWLALDEDERLALVRDYHKRARIRLPNLAMHAIAHAIVENQIALGDETAAQRTAARLMKEGLDRHEAIHAIASVLMGRLFELVKAPDTADEPNAGDDDELDRLTAEGWRRSFD